MDSESRRCQMCGMGRHEKPARAGAKKPHYSREWRKHHGLTQEQLAFRIEKTQGAISQLELFQTEYTQGMLESIAYALQCTPADLLMHNPLDTEAPWSIWEKLTPPQRE